MQNNQKNKLQILGVVLVIISVVGIFASIKKSPGPYKTTGGNNEANKVTVESKVSNKVASETNVEEHNVDSHDTDVYSQAIKRAQTYLNIGPSMPPRGLREQLEFEGFTHDVAVYALANCGKDWNKQAVIAAKDHLSSLPYSYSALIKQLEDDGYTTKQAVYGVDNCNADWYAQAVKEAELFLESVPSSRNQLIDMLQRQGYSYEQAVYGAENNKYSK